MIMMKIFMIIMMFSGAVFRVLCATQRPMAGRLCPLLGRPQHYTALQALLAPATHITMRYAPEVDWGPIRGGVDEEQQE